MTDQTITAGSCYAFHQLVNSKNQFMAGSYDAAGNLLGDGVHNYAYDAENRIQYVDRNADGSYYAGFYVYDADGRRVGRAANGSTTYYVYHSDGQVAAEFDGNNNWLQSYLYFGSALVALYRGSNTGFYHKDHLGSTRLITLSDQNQTVYDNMDYLPFGTQIAGTSATSHKFTGKERDSESGLDDFDARHYGSSLGRFMSPDPAGLLAQKPTSPQSWNLYAYAMNNPLIFIDPTGLDCVYANDAGNGVESIDHNSNSGECGQNGGSWAPGYADENWAHFNNSTGMFQVGSINGAGNSATVDYTMFEAGAQTQFNGDESSCVSGCAGFSLANANWLQSMLVGSSRIGGLDGMISFMVNREDPLSPGWLMRLAAGPGLSPNAPDNWAGKGGMGPPQNQSDWAAMVHDYNFDANLINIGSYFNPHLSLATSKALITSNNTLLRNVGGSQRAKMGLFFGPLNAFQWYANSWK